MEPNSNDVEIFEFLVVNQRIPPNSTGGRLWSSTTPSILCFDQRQFGIYNSRFIEAALLNFWINFTYKVVEINGCEVGEFVWKMDFGRILLS